MISGKAACISLAAVAVCALLTVPAATQGRGGGTSGPVLDRLSIPLPKPGDRIQVNRWTDPKLGVDDPLYQIVRILDRGESPSAGTGFLLPDCRLMTAAHVVAAAINGGRYYARTADKLDFVGEQLEFETRPLPSLGGRKAKGHFRVIGHGVTGPAYWIENFVEQDWAIGYDDECLADKLNLGTVEPAWIDISKFFDPARPLGFEGGLIKSTMTDAEKTGFEGQFQRRDYFTAGYSTIDVPGIAHDQWPLYVDTRCHFGDVTGNIFRQIDLFTHGTVATDCSIWFGGSGQPLLSPSIVDGKVERDVNGRPRLRVFGWFPIGVDHDSSGRGLSRRQAVEAGTLAPRGAVLGAFSTTPTGTKIRSLLGAPLNGSATASFYDEAARARDLDSDIRMAVRQRFASAPVRPAPRTEALRDCLNRSSAAPVADRACTLALQDSRLTQEEVLDAFTFRARSRRAQGSFGLAVRDYRTALAQAIDPISQHRHDGRRIDLYAAIGETFKAAGMLPEARGVYDQAIELVKQLPVSDATARRQRARLFGERGIITDVLAAHRVRAADDEPLHVTFLEAVADFSEALLFDPSNPAWWNGRCYASASTTDSTKVLDNPSERRLRLALDDCNKALTLTPNSAGILDSRGFTYLKLGLVDKALADFEAALRVDPGIAESLFARGIIKWSKHDERGARADWEAAGKINGDVDTLITGRGQVSGVIAGVMAK